MAVALRYQLGIKPPNLRIGGTLTKFNFTIILNSSSIEILKLRIIENLDSKKVPPIRGLGGQK